MAVKKPKRSVKPELTDTQKVYLKNYQKEVSECVLTIADSIERQQTTYGEQKSHSWRNCGDNIKDKTDEMRSGFSNMAEILSNRIFDQSGCSIEVKSLLDLDNKNEINGVNAIVGLSSSTKRDKETGLIKHDENDTTAYVYISSTKIGIINPGEINKTVPIDRIASTHGTEWINQIDLKKDALSGKEPDSEAWMQHISEGLGKIDEKFPALFEAVMSNRDKQFVEAQPDSTTLLEDKIGAKAKLDSTLQKTITTEEVKSSRSFFSKLLGRDKDVKDKNNEGR